MAPESELTILSRILSSHRAWTITEAGPRFTGTRPEPMPREVSAETAAGLEAKLDRLAEAEMHAPRSRYTPRV
jgi:hypothetical protein